MPLEAATRRKQNKTVCYVHEAGRPQDAQQICWGRSLQRMIFQRNRLHPNLSCCYLAHEATGKEQELAEAQQQFLGREEEAPSSF